MLQNTNHITATDRCNQIDQSIGRSINQSRVNSNRREQIRSDHIRSHQTRSDQGWTSNTSADQSDDDGGGDDKDVDHDDDDDDHNSDDSICRTIHITPPVSIGIRKLSSNWKTSNSSTSEPVTLARKDQNAIALPCVCCWCARHWLIVIPSTTTTATTPDRHWCQRMKP